ncbi:MAG: hypothetical protein ACP5C4_01070 [Methanomicrobiales archaeon]
MGLGSIVASGLVVLLMLVAVYALVGVTLTTAEVVATAQAEQTVHHETRMHTGITVLDAARVNATSTVYVEVENTGSEPVTGNFSYMEVFLLQGNEISGYETVRYPYGTSGYAWSIVEIAPDIVHPGMLDPDEVLNLSVHYDSSRGSPAWMKVTTPNGVSGSTYLEDP